MTETKVDWTEEQFKAYLLIYMANSNFLETEEEKELILSKVAIDMYKKMHKEHDVDNDYQRLQKILFCIEKFNYSHEDLKKLSDEIRELLNTDGYHDEVEDEVFLYLKKFLK